MVFKAGWMPTLVDRINRGCRTSGLLAAIHGEDSVTAGQDVCLSLWPVIKDLPVNISSVRDSLPTHMESAQKLLSQLADDERHYQKLYIKQCHLSGLTAENLALAEPSPQTKQLCDAMNHYCRDLTYREGVLAVVTAELAATAIARFALPVYEKYFSEEKHQYSPVEVEEGLEWLRLHSRPQTRHALWLIRMLADIETAKGQSMPKPAEDILNGFYGVWRCPQPDTHSTGRIAEGVH